MKLKVSDLTINNPKIKLKDMKTEINKFGEEVTKWQSNKHPDNPNFQQVVNWTIWVKPDGKVTVGYNLDYNGKTKFIYGLTKEEAITKYS